MHAERLFPAELWPQIPAAVQDSMHAHDARPSSRPPSRDPPQATTKRPGRDLSGRQAGGQPGHEGQARALGPAEARAAGPGPLTAYRDATGWRAGRQRVWLWTAVTAGLTVVVVRRARRGMG